jgi:PAS domain S-box-containing protein
MNDAAASRDELARAYATALQAYVSGAGESALVRAYELGRQASSAGMGVLELALIHHQALLGLPPAGSAGAPAIAVAGQFLAESLSPFEMTLRSYQDNARLLGLSDTLVQQNAEIDRAREQLRAILDATTAVIYLKDAQGRYLFVNRQFQQVFGCDREQVLGRRDDEVLPAPVASAFRTDDGEVLAGRVPRELERTIAARDGPRTYISLKFPLLDAEGAAYGVCCVATDITERKRAEEAAQRAREAAERERHLQQAVQARDEFIAIASHELRTPLTSLELHLANFRRLARTSPRLALSEPEVQSRCDAIARQADRLAALVNTFLDVARITAGRLELTPERVDLPQLVREVLERMQEAIQWSRSSVAVSSDGPVVGSWDRAGLQTVVANLLSNALKFGEGKPIEITTRAEGDRARLTVVDHGMGISPDDQERIFERFERAVPSRHFGGFGIGLWVARQTLEALGGTIRSTSEPGCGSTFVVELPLARRA